MQPIDLIASIIQLVGGIPAAGQYVALALGLVVSISAVVTALVAVWHAVVVAVGALSHVQGLQGLKGLADSLKADEDKISDFENSKLLPILNRLSAIPLPQVPAVKAP